MSPGSFCERASFQYGFNPAQSLSQKGGVGHLADVGPWLPARRIGMSPTPG